MSALLTSFTVHDLLEPLGSRRNRMAPEDLSAMRRAYEAEIFKRRARRDHEGSPRENRDSL